MHPILQELLEIDTKGNKLYKEMIDRIENNATEETIQNLIDLRNEVDNTIDRIIENNEKAIQEKDKEIAERSKKLEALNNKIKTLKEQLKNKNSQ